MGEGAGPHRGVEEVGEEGDHDDVYSQNERRD